MTGQTAVFAAGDGSDVKTLKEAYERHLKQLNANSKTDKPVEKPPFRRVFHSVSVIKLIESDASFPSTSEPSSPSSSDKQSMGRGDDQFDMREDAEDPFSPDDDRRETHNKQKGSAAHRTGNVKVTYCPIGYQNYAAYAWIDAFQRVIDELQEAQTLLLKKKLLKKTENERRVPIKQSPKPEDTLRMARSKLRRSTDPGTVFQGY